MKKISTIVVAALITVSAVSSSYAIVGIGFHWGFDMSMSMENVPSEKVEITPKLEGLDLSFLDDEASQLLKNTEFFSVSRLNWGRSPINFGGKVYVDFIPFIDAVELSCNFGMWQYDGALSYVDVSPSGLASLAADGIVKRDTIPLTLKAQGVDYIGLSGTPYAKLHFDATVRKMVLNLWLIKFNAGAGVSAHFATPLLSSKLIESALGVKIDNPDFLKNLANPAEGYGKDIVQEIINQALGKPALGMHLLVGAQAKLPVVPVGIYIDGKFMIPFSKFDDDAGAGVKGYGFLINTGLSLSI